MREPYAKSTWREDRDLPEWRPTHHALDDPASHSWSEWADVVCGFSRVVSDSWSSLRECSPHWPQLSRRECNTSRYVVRVTQGSMDRWILLSIVWSVLYREETARKKKDPRRGPTARPPSELAASTLWRVAIDTGEGRPVTVVIAVYHQAAGVSLLDGLTRGHKDATRAPGAARNRIFAPDLRRNRPCQV